MCRYGKKSEMYMKVEKMQSMIPCRRRKWVTRVQTYILHACGNSYSDSGVYILTWTYSPPPRSCGLKKAWCVGRGRRRCFYLVLFRVTWLYFLLCFLSKTVKWKNVVKFVAALYLASLPAPPKPRKTVCAKHTERRSMGSSDGRSHPLGSPLTAGLPRVSQKQGRWETPRARRILLLVLLFCFSLCLWPQMTFTFWCPDVKTIS